MGTPEGFFVFVVVVVVVVWLHSQYMEVPGPGNEHMPHPRHCSDNAKSLTCWATREFP